MNGTIIINGDGAKRVGVILKNCAQYTGCIRITGSTPTTGNTKDIKIAVPLKYLSIYGKLLKCF